MEIFQRNAWWMVVNCFLAVLPVYFAYLLVKSRSKFLTVVWGVLWLLFLPNSMYVITDLQHLLHDWWMFTLFEKSVSVLQYSLLEITGLCSFVLALYPVEKKVRHVMKAQARENITVVLIILNFLVGFGMVLGKVERINSWEVFTKPSHVSQAIIHIFQTPDLMALFVLFSLFVNFYYFLTSKTIYTYFLRAL